MAVKKVLDKDQKPTGKWQVDYRDAAGKRVFKRLPSRAAALDYELQIKTAKAGGTLVDTCKGGKLRFADLYAEWIARIETVGSDGEAAASPVTVAGYRQIYGKHIKPFMEHRTLANVTLPVVNEWLGTFSSDDARRRAYRQLGRMLQFAMDSGYVATNPARNARLNMVKKPVPSRIPAALTASQVQALAKQCATGGRYAAAAHDAYLLLILFAGTTGLRWSEIAGLRVNALSLAEVGKAVVTVRSTLVPVAGRLEFREATKNGETRKVPIPATVAALLAEHVDGMSPDATVFTSPSGAPLRSSNFARRVFHPAVTACQAIDPTFPDMVFHDLRRTAVSLSIKTGKVNIKVVQRIAGHSSAVTTLDVYAKAFQDDLHGAGAALDALIAGTAGDAVQDAAS